MITQLPNKYPPLFATIEPNSRNVPVDPTWGIPDIEGGHYYHEAVFMLFTGSSVQVAIIDGKYAPGMDEVTLAMAADLMYVLAPSGDRIRPIRPDTIIDCPKGHGKMKRCAAVDVNLLVQVRDGRQLVANFPMIDVPTCLSCGSAACDEIAQTEIEQVVEAALIDSKMTTLTVAQNPITKEVHLFRRWIGAKVQLFDPKRGVTKFPTIPEAMASIPREATKMPKMPKEVDGVVGVWLIETAKMPEVKMYN